MNNRSFIIYGSTLFMLLSATSVFGDENSRTGVSWEDFRVISERNIFSRNRIKIERPQLNESRNIQRVERREEGYLILRGITKQADRFVAFIEDSRTMKVKKALKGEMIGKSTINDINLDYITCEFEGKISMVKIGMTMGEQTSVNLSVYPSGNEPLQQQSFSNFSSNNQTDMQVSPDNENTKNILQRLKERRKKELGE